jgi:hypothetical protein
VYERFAGRRKEKAKAVEFELSTTGKKPDHEIWMLTIYSKSERSTIPGHILRQIAEAIDHE